MKRLFQLAVVITAVNFSIAQNVMITDRGNPNEPSIMFNPDNPNIVVAGILLDDYYYSSDGGKTWSGGKLKSTYGVWGDPVIDIDSKGNFYYFHLSNPSNGNWIDRIVCQKSTDNGKTWSKGTYVGLNGRKAQDKQWSIIDRNNDNIYLTWTQFDKYDSSSSFHKTIIRFSKSTDGGDTWSEPKKINEVDGDCVDSDNTVEGAMPAIGPKGEVYVAWTGPNGIVFNKSLDQGDTWLDKEIKIDPMPGGWDFKIPGVDRTNGFPITKCDLSNSEHRGTIYINWSDQRNGTSNTDIWLSKSVDGGETWSAPKRVNDDDSNKHQFFTWMDIDQTTGYLYCLFYDRRNYSNNQTDVYMAISKDGGETFENIKISESPFTPDSSVFFGDYTNIYAHNGIVRPIWTRVDGVNLSVWTDITPNLSVKKQVTDISKSNEVKHYPNPSDAISYVSYKLKKTSKVSLELYNKEGQKVHTILNKEQKPYGRYIQPIKLDELKLPSGMYFCKLTIDNNTKTLKSIVIK